MVGASGDQKLHGYDGDTGAVVFAGGGANETMAGTHSYNTTGIAARGRIYVAGDNKVYAFVTPGGLPTPTPTPSATPSQQQQLRHPPGEPYALAKNNTQVAPDSSVASESSAATVTRTV